MEIFEIRAKCDCGLNEIKIKSSQPIPLPIICGYCKRRIDFHVEQPNGEEPKSDKDIDIIEGGTPAHERGKIRYLIKIIQAKFFDQKEIKIEELKKEAEKLGLTEIDDAIEQLLKNGEYYKPHPDILAKV